MENDARFKINQEPSELLRITIITVVVGYTLTKIVIGSSSGYRDLYIVVKLAQCGTHPPMKNVGPSFRFDLLKSWRRGLNVVIFVEAVWQGSMSNTQRFVGYICCGLHIEKAQLHHWYH